MTRAKTKDEVDQSDTIYLFEAIDKSSILMLESEIQLCNQRTDKNYIVLAYIYEIENAVGKTASILKKQL